MGVDQDHAYAWKDRALGKCPADIFSEWASRREGRKGGWAIAQSPILGTTITLKRLKQKGYLSLTELYIQLNPSLCEPPSVACPDFYRDDP